MAFTQADIIARFVAEATDNTERVVCCVRELIDEAMNSKFEVFIDGGLLADGEESFISSNLMEALATASTQVFMALQGD